MGEQKEGELNYRDLFKRDSVAVLKYANSLIVLPSRNGVQISFKSELELVTHFTSNQQNVAKVVAYHFLV